MNARLRELITRLDSEKVALPEALQIIRTLAAQGYFASP